MEYSIQDVANSAYRIKEAAKELQTRTMLCSRSLDRHVTQLAAVVRGSRTGEQAVQEVRIASKAVRDASASLLTLQNNADSFIKELTK